MPLIIKDGKLVSVDWRGRPIDPSKSTRRSGRYRTSDAAGLIVYNGAILVRNGKLAASTNCCCGPAGPGCGACTNNKAPEFTTVNTGTVTNGTLGCIPSCGCEGQLNGAAITRRFFTTTTVGTIISCIWIGEGGDPGGLWYESCSQKRGHTIISYDSSTNKSRVQVGLENNNGWWDTGWTIDGKIDCMNMEQDVPFDGQDDPCCNFTGPSDENPGDVGFVADDVTVTPG